MGPQLRAFGTYAGIVCVEAEGNAVGSKDASTLVFASLKFLMVENLAPLIEYATGSILALRLLENL